MKKRFKTIYLHIGLGKTGTSTIQNNLYANKEVLEKKFSIIYPTFDLGYQHFLENHNIFIKSLFSKNATQLYHNVLNGINTQEKLAKENKKYIESFNQQIKVSSAENMVLSAEAITSLDILGSKKLVDWLMTFAENLFLIAAFRHPMDSISSDIQQQIKIGYNLEVMLKPQLSNIRHNVQKFKSSIDFNHMIFYSFKEAIEHPHGIFGKFLEVLNLPYEEFTVEKKSHFNQSISMEGTLLLGILNKHRPLLSNNQKQSNRTKQEIIFLKKLKGEKFKVPKKFMERFIKVIKLEDSWLEKTLGIKLDKIYSIESFSNILNLNKKTITLLSKLTEYSEEFISKQLQDEYLHIGDPSVYPASKLHEVAIVISDQFNKKKMEA